MPICGGSIIFRSIVGFVFHGLHSGLALHSAPRQCDAQRVSYRTRRETAQAFVERKLSQHFAGAEFYMRVEGTEQAWRTLEVTYGNDSGSGNVVYEVIAGDSSDYLARGV
jgi:hypothetical protein